MADGDHTHDLVDDRQEVAVDVSRDRATGCLAGEGSEDSELSVW
jgi:hypothetical protein